MPLPSSKLHGTMDASGSAAAKYLALTYGPIPTWKALLQEFLTLLLSNIPGALGLALRGAIYPKFFASCGRKVAFGRSITLRHACKIHLGDGVILDDNCVIDAKGDGNDGIRLDAGVYVGRNTIIYCKGGSIHCHPRVSLSANCILFSSNQLTIGEGTTIGAFSYALSGGEYDPSDPTPFTHQSGMCTRGPLSIGSDCWLGTRVTVLDGAQHIGNRCVLGAGTVVTHPLPDHTTAVGIPAKPISPKNSNPTK